MVGVTRSAKENELHQRITDLEAQLADIKTLCQRAADLLPLIGWSATTDQLDEMMEALSKAARNEEGE